MQSARSAVDGRCQQLVRRTVAVQTLVQARYLHTHLGLISHCPSSTSPWRMYLTDYSEEINVFHARIPLLRATNNAQKNSSTLVLVRRRHCEWTIRFNMFRSLQTWITRDSWQLDATLTHSSRSVSVLIRTPSEDRAFRPLLTYNLHKSFYWTVK